MSEFDDLMEDADVEIFLAVGGSAVLNNPDVANHDVLATVDRDVEHVFEDRVMVIDFVLTIQKPPEGVSKGWLLQVGSDTYTLRELLNRDGFVESWQATRLAAG